MISRRLFFAAACSFIATPALASRWQDRLVAAAETQIGRTLHYDPAYVRISYPGGDVPIARGVCTDVVIRAYRDGLGLDLQKLVHEDMAAHFPAYPQSWGLKRPDTQHRPPPGTQPANLFQAARGGARGHGGVFGYAPGDLVTMMLPGNLPHIAIVSMQMNDDGSRPLLIHNIGGGTQRQDVLFTYPVTGHYRYYPRPA